MGTLAERLACDRPGCACQQAARRGEGLVHCPSHNDAHPSLSVSERDGKLLLFCHAGCSQGEVIAALRARNLWPRDERRIVQQRRYPLVGADGAVVAVHERIDYADGSKSFAWYRNGQPSLGNLKTPDLPLYRLPDLLSAPADATVILVEGEKSADALAERGFLAVGTATGAAGTPSEATLKPLAGRNVVLWPDNDEPGRQHMDRIAQRLTAMGTVARVLEWPDAPPGGDAGDFFARGGADDELRALLAAARPWTPAGSERAEPTGDARQARRSQADLLVEVALAGGVELFHDPLGEAYAAISLDGHRETWPVRSAGFRRWLARQFYQRERKAPNASAVTDALLVVEGRAQFDGDERVVFTRVGEDSGGSIYIDLGDPTWEAVQVDRSGWQIVTNPPVHFRRSPTMAALPRPQRGGSVNALRRFVNVGSDETFRLVVAWLIGCLRPRGPYPILALLGEHGSAKTFTARVLKSLVDPSTNPLRGLPREARDVFIGARHNHVLGFDNLSSIPPWLSDLLCGLATGTSGPVRSLYTNDEEVPHAAMRPVIITSIEDIMSRADLLDRAIICSPPPIPAGAQRPERLLLAEFEAEAPAIFGAVLDGVSAALRNINQVGLDDLPRMADFGEWVVAAEAALPWERGGFMQAYARSIDDANTLALEASAVSAAILEMSGAWGDAGWQGTASDLLELLSAKVSEDRRHRRDWPSSARALANAIRRIAPNLRCAGVDVSFDREKRAARRRLIILRTVSDLSQKEGENIVHFVHSVHSELGGVDEQGGRVDDTSSTSGSHRPLLEAENELAVDAVDDVDDVLQPSSACESRLPDREPCAGGCGRQMPSDHSLCSTCAAGAPSLGDRPSPPAARACVSCGGPRGVFRPGDLCLICEAQREAERWRL